MRKSFSVIVMSAALLITGGTAADAAGVATSTSAGTRKVIKTVSAGKVGAIVVKTRPSRKVIKTAKPAKRAVKPAVTSTKSAAAKKAAAKKLAAKRLSVKVIKTAKRK